MKINTYLAPFFPENEEHLANSIVVYIDVLRATTTICAALANGAREVIPIDTIEKAVSLFSQMSKETTILAGERNGIKLNGFTLGNSPADFTPEMISGKSVILTTTNGTLALQKGKHSHERLICSFNNISAVSAYIINCATKYNEPNPLNFLNIICSGNNGTFSYEDALCTGALIRSILDGQIDLELSDSSDAALVLFNSKRDVLDQTIINGEHARALIKIGLESDVQDALVWDKYSLLPVVTGNSIKIMNN